ncbi:hypothetical protein TBR22_A45790 [Luteitalea sp. TBR-22]|uniref:TraB/GumN family protein n=1 Tax=Luteitalea sp. TBR-22 TaxID=2802971 RepID=UPI001AFC66DD|nr:TraB/GumN family protein [Luteitalea sp. TBR-22]BCS35352.1 hypothetical protein TBR22_A45790 [Luteitalea sp. TBR-22]
MPRITATGGVLAAILALVLALPARPAARAQAAPLLWLGQQGTHRVALFGTIHVPDARVLALPPAVKAAFDRADRVVTEIPLSAQSQAQMATALLLPPDQRLRAIIGEARFARLHARVRAVLASKAPEIAPLVGGMLDRLKPWAAMAQLATLDYLPDLLAGRTSLDATLYADAEKAGKAVGGLETVAEQAGTFDAFTPEEQGRLLDEALHELETPGQSATGAQLVEWYLAGDAEKLATALAGTPDDEALAKKFETEVLVKRNHRMASRVDALRREAPAETLFVAVGALHLVGPENLPQLLQVGGYAISRVQP